MCSFPVGKLLKKTDRKSVHVYDATRISSWLCGANMLNALMNGSPNFSSGSVMPAMRHRLPVMSFFLSFMMANVPLFYLLYYIFDI